MSTFEVLAAVIVGLLTGSIATAQTQGEPATQARQSQAPDTSYSSTATEREARPLNATQREAKDAQKQVDEAVKVVSQMKNDPQLTTMLEHARGVFILPDFGKAALGIGARGGEGVLLVKRNGEWSGPAFFNFGRFSAGLQAGVAAGAIAMVLMTEDAVHPFTSQQSNFALDATAGLTVMNYSAQGRVASGEPDVVMWSDTEGLFAGASIGVSGITRDESENSAYYSRQASPQEIFSGKVKNPRAESLREALPTQSAARQ